MPDVRKNIDVVIRAHDETRRGVQSADAAMSSFSKTTLALGITAAGAAAGIRVLANDMDQLQKTARQLGTTTEQVQQLSYAARIMDIEFGALTHSVVELQRRLDDPKIAVALSRIGLRIEDLKDQDPATALSKISDALAGMESQSIKAATAYELFGRQGREILAAMASGSEELNRLMAEAPVIPEESVKALGEFGDQLDKLEMNAKTAAVTILGPLMEGVNALIAGMERLRKLGSGLAGLLPWSLGNQDWGGRTGHMGRPRMLEGEMEFVPGIGKIPTSRTSAVSDINQPTTDLLRAITQTLHEQSMALRVRGAQIGPASMRVGGSLRGMDFAGPVGMFPMSAEEEKQNAALEERIGHLANLRDEYDALRDGIREVEVQGESLGATLVDGAFRWADAWSRGLALVMTKQAEFSDIGRRLFRSMVSDMIAWINQLIARQIVSAVLSAILGGGNPAQVAAAVSAAGASAAGSTSLGGGNFAERAFRPPRIATGDFGRNVTLNANISATFASRAEMQAAAVTLARMAQAEFAR